MSWGEFFHMGGYAFYVWSAYGISFIALLFTLLLPRWQHKQLRNKLAKKIRRERQTS